MNDTRFIRTGILVLLICLRQLTHWLTARSRKPAVSRTGFASVAVWFLIYILLLILAVRYLLNGATTPFIWLGLGIYGLGILLRIAALLKLGRMYSEAIAIREDHQVIQDGVYRFLRHPLHLALIFEMTGLVCLTGNPLWALLLIPALTVYILRGLHEERILCENLGEDYRQYLNSNAWDLLDIVPKCWRPYISKKSIESSEK